MALESALQLWDILLLDRFPKLIVQWTSFLKSKGKSNAVSKDTWLLLFDFFLQQERKEEYDENEAWPVLIDEFMQYKLEESSVESL